MKKVMIAIVAALVLTACGGNAEQAPAADSLKVDSTVLADTTAQVVDTTAKAK